jgi:hypothetical protein
MGRLAGFHDHFGGVQQRLGGNATAVQADAAKFIVLLDKQNLLAEISRIKRGRVAARAGAQNDYLCLNRIHDDNLLLFGSVFEAAG